MEDRYLGVLEGSTWAEVGYKVAQLTAPWRQIPFQRMWSKAQRKRDGVGSGDHWKAIARRAAEAIDAQGDDFATSKAFLQGAAEAGGAEMWQLFTLYELESASLVAPLDFEVTPEQETSKSEFHEQSGMPVERVKASTWRRSRKSAVAGAEGPALTGCTGLGCFSGLLGQTEEVDVSVYDYGKEDVVYRLRCRAESQGQSTALVYDPACTFCPIGLGRSAIGVTRFALYPSEVYSEKPEKEAEGGLPLVAVLWELLLGDRSLEESVHFLETIFKDSASTMAAGASLMLGQEGRGVVVAEWSRSQLWVSPTLGESALVTRANHSLSTSFLRDSAAVQDILDESRARQDSVDQFIAEELLAGRTPPLSPQQVQAALSTPRVQNDHVLATVVVCPAELELHVRFRLQTHAMQLAEQTVARNFWLRFTNADADVNRKKRWAKKP